MEAKELDLLGVQRYWSEAESLLKRAVYGADPDGYVRNVRAALFAGINTLWRIEESGVLSGYVVTNFYTVDGLSKVAQIHLMTVESMKEVLSLLDYFEVWAKTQGAEWVEVIGRKGWERVLKPYGFNHEYTSLLKRITEIH